MPGNYKEKMQIELGRLKHAENQKKAQEAKDAALKNLTRERELDLKELQDRAQKAQSEPGRNREELVSHWDNATFKADEILNKEITSINDWRATMSSTLVMCIALNKAIAGSVYLIYAQDVSPSVRAFLYPYYDKLVGNPKANFNPDMTLPSLAHGVQMDANDVLHIAPLVRSDKVEIANEQPQPGQQRRKNLNDLFKEGVDMWLRECGYTEDRPGVYRDANGVQLTQAVFNALKANPDHGLGVFLSEGAELVFTEAPEEAPVSRL